MKEAPLVPVPSIGTHGLPQSCGFLTRLVVNVKLKGAAESVFTVLPSLVNTTLRVFAFA